MSADRIRLADPPPAHCSGCFQQKPHMRHVDFEAAWDGPALPALEGAVGVVAHHIDELILCEECLTTGARLIGLQDVTALIKARARLEETRDELLGKVAALEEHNYHLRSALTSGGEVQRVMRPKPIPPSPAALPLTEPGEQQRRAASSPRSAPKPKRKPEKRQSAAAKAAAHEGGQK